MKKFKTLVYVLTLTLLLTSCIILTSCTVEVGGGDEQKKNESLTVESVYSMAVESGYDGTLDEFIAEFKGEKGADGVGIEDAGLNSSFELIITLTNGKRVNCGKISIPKPEPTVIGIGENGNWMINGEDTGYRAEGIDGTVWHTGTLPPAVNAGKDGDLYLDSSTCDLYKKNLGVWSIIANLKGESGDVTVNEGDTTHVTVNAPEGSEKYAAAKGMLSAVSIEADFVGQNFYSQYKYTSRGSGVIIHLDKSAGDAYVITNYHVVYDRTSLNTGHISDTIRINIYGKEFAEYSIPATFVGGAHTYDIAVIKISGSEILRESAAVEAELADSDTVRILDTAIAIGNPEGLGLSATLGAVSVESQHLDMTAADGITAVSYRVMRIDTPINGGNSGGGLFDSSGRLIGIVNAKEKDATLENMGYAIPSNLALSVAENIIRSCDGVESVSPLVYDDGISVAIVEAGAELNGESGVIDRYHVSVVSELSETSPANGILQISDRILSVEIGGVTYEVNFSFDVDEALLNLTPDDTLVFNVIRGGEKLSLTVPVSAEDFLEIP